MTAEIEGFIGRAAEQRGIDPAVALRVARSEGGVDEYCVVGMFPTGWSFWAYQLHYGGAGYEQYGTVAGMGIGFTKLTHWQPGSPEAWRDATRYALNRAKASGWGAWYGAAHVGIAQWEGIDTSHPWDANAETWDYERFPTYTVLQYNPALIPERQVQDWTCSIRATTWALKSMGIPVEADTMQDAMVPRYVTPDLGLRDARGYGLAEALRLYLPEEWHPRVHVLESLDWSHLWERAGTGPICLGLRGAYHWINVAAPQADGTLVSPNPAPKYPSGYPIGDVLTRTEFDTFGPSSLVWLDAQGIATVPSTPPPPDPYDPYGAWRATVGSGLLDMMEQDDTLPAQRASTWLPLDTAPSDIEVCSGQNGIAYHWQLTTGRGFRYAPV